LFENSICPKSESNCNGFGIISTATNLSAIFICVYSTLSFRAVGAFPDGNDSTIFVFQRRMITERSINFAIFTSTNTSMPF
jgi:hypothetical protein